ncbi:MAG: porphobilinogen synthase [Peptococcaceae bacterium]|nr:porphobilinogen synthase [Peptococcaceae bacterium]
MDLIVRPRRLRTDRVRRELVRETRVSKSSLVLPIFIREGKKIVEEIAALSGHSRYSPDMLPYFLETVQKAGIKSVLLFGIPLYKDEQGSGAYDENGVVQQAVRIAKEHFPDIQIITDVCLCEYTSHGHCGMLNDNRVDNDKTLPLIARTALSHVQAGADIVAPSDMMDGRVKAIREALDLSGFTENAIMSYAVKYSSSFYGPFREAAGSSPSFGDRKSYQMDYHNSREALKEAELDLLEGADILMVKPALAYLDIVTKVRSRFNVPIAAYSVSGEYALVKQAHQAGLIDETEAFCEIAVGIFRAGADILITYSALELAKWIDEGRIG